MTYTHREKISVITINLNNAEGLRRTLDSVFRQTTHDFELVVVDGASTDGSVELIHTHADRIDRWVSEPDGGIYNAMNKAVAMATGEYVIFMNSGDTFYEDDVLARVIPQLKGKDIYVGDLHRPGKRKKFVKAPDEVYFHYIITRTLSHQAAFIRRQRLLDQPYNEENKIVSDWEWFFRELVFSDATYEHLNLCVATFDPSGISSLKEMESVRLEEMERVREKLIPPRLRKALIGNTRYERKIMYGMQQSSVLRRDMIMLRNMLKLLLHDVWHGLCRR